MLVSTPSKKFINNIKSELIDIASLSKRNLYQGSPDCLKSLKRMQKIVSQSGIKTKDKEQINHKLQSIERSLSPKKSRTNNVSSTHQHSEKTHKNNRGDSSHKKYNKKYNYNTQNTPFEIRELQMRNKMLEEQILSYKQKVKQARKAMMNELKEDEDTMNLDIMELDQTRREVREHKKQIRTLLKQNQKLKQSLEDKDEIIHGLKQQNKWLKHQLSQRKQKPVDSMVQQDRLQKDNEIERLKIQIKRLKIEKIAFDKKTALLSSNQKLKEIVKRYKSYI